MINFFATNRSQKRGNWVRTRRKWGGMSLFILVAATMLSSCASRPYFCQYVAYPQGKKMVDGDWTYLASICETKIARDLFTREDGVMLNIVVEDASKEILSQRKIFFFGVDSTDVTSYWSSADSLTVEVREKHQKNEVAVTSTPLAEIHVSLTKP